MACIRGKKDILTAQIYLYSYQAPPGGGGGEINSHPVKYIPLTHIFTNYVRLITNFGLPLKAEGFCIHEIKVYIY